MKSVFTILAAMALLMPTPARAAFGIYESYVIIGGTYYDLFATTGNPDFSGANLGTFTTGGTLSFNGGQIKTYKESNSSCPGGNVCGGTISWSVTGGGSGNNSLGYNVSFGNQSSGCSVNQQWDFTTGSTNILSGLTAGNYTIAVFCSATGHQSNNGLCSQSVQQGALTASFTVSAPAPIEVIDFHWKKTSDDRGILLSWRTETERNNDRFEIERSTDAQNWTNIGTVPTKSSDSNRQLSYEFTDPTPAHGINYYRLRQLDKDGKSILVKSIKALIDQPIAYRLYPNPAEGNMIQIAFGTIEKAVQLRLMDAQGKMLKSWSADAEPHSVLPLDLSPYPSGILFLQIDGETTRVVH